MIFFFPTIPTTEFILSSTHCIRLVWAASSSQRPGSSVLKMEMGPLQRSSCSSSTRSAADWQPQWILDAGRYPLQTHRCLQKTQANILDGHGNRHRDRAWQMQLQIGKISVFFLRKTAWVAWALSCHILDSTIKSSSYVVFLDLSAPKIHVCPLKKGQNPKGNEASIFTLAIDFWF